MKEWNIEICDVTLRDGEQTPGVTFSSGEKLEIARLLDAVGVEVIEAGFPVVSGNERKSVAEIARAGLSARTCCLARAVRGDVECAIDCGVDMVSIFLATSDLHLRVKYRKDREAMLAEALDVVEYAADHGVDVRFAAEDASRTDVDLLIQMFRLGAERGATLASFADTVGALTPLEIYDVVRRLVSEIPLPLSIHCHNDLGFASANTITAAAVGAFQLHTTINGIGERAGNAALEEVLVALRLKGGIDRYDLTHLPDCSRMVAEYSGIDVAKTKAVVGENAFAHESGIHIAAILTDPATYEFIPPEMLGLKRRFVIGKHSGRRAIRHVARKYGYDLTDEQLRWILLEIKRLSEGKCEITPPLLCDLLRQATKERR
ncbi:MAG: homocitrate synthase family protein [Methanoculleaceae archaeon]